MKVVNQSHRAQSDILPLVEFVAARMTYADMAYLHLHPGQYNEDGAPRVGRGQAVKNNFNSAGTTPSRVDLWLARGVCFPRDDHYPEAGVGIVVLTDWREEFVLALAHELRHIDQFWWTRPMPANIEHDAESFAVTVLNDWRKTQGRAVILPFQVAQPLKRTSKPARRAARRSRP